MTSVRVYVRVRPFNSREKGLGELRLPIVLKGKDVVIEERQKKYSFDCCFSPTASQEEVFEVVGMKVTGDFMEGFNATQFVYGQTGSGKTWTMMGIEEQRGLIPRSAAMIFEVIDQRESGWSFEIDASYLEIYMEKVNDLLDPDKVNLALKEDRKSGVFVHGLTKESVSSLDDVYDMLARGDKVRKVASTKMNAGSSRSHSVLSIFLQQTDPAGVKKISQLNLVDLAGSERSGKTGASGTTLSQGNAINQSLTTLSRVINGLSKKAENPDGSVPIPFRDSKLTRLLQTSLGGNSKTGLSIHLSPHIDNLDESISTCEFGRRAKLIKTNAKKVVQKSAAQLEEEIERLRKDYNKLLEAFKLLTGGQVDGLERGASGASAGGGGGDSGGPVVSFRELEVEREKVQDLSADMEQLNGENSNLAEEIRLLENQLKDESEQVDSLRQRFSSKESEVKRLENQLEGMTTNSAGGGQTEIVDDAPAVVSSASAKAIEELNALIAAQREQLNRERDQNRELKQENVELADELAEKTRRLALAELQVIRYETARNKAKDGKIKVKITPNRAKPNAWGDDHDQQTGVMTARTKATNYESIREGTILEKFGNLTPVPQDELKGGRNGYLYERLYKTADFVKRLFVVRDSYLVAYNDQNSPPTQPKYVIPIAESKVGACPKQGDRDFCFMVLCGQYFNVLAASTESEKNVWLKDLASAKFVTHENLLNLAHFNMRAVETIEDSSEREKVSSTVRHADYSALGEREYSQDVPISGTMEGFLNTSGFGAGPPNAGQAGGKDNSSEWRELFCLVKDSHFLVYDMVNHSELLTEPVGVVHLGAAGVDIGDNEEEDEDGLVRYYITIVAGEDSFSLFTTNLEMRDRWIHALRIGCCVTIRNTFLASLHRETIAVKAGINPVVEADLVNKMLNPLCVQPYDVAGKALYRHPDGRLLTKDMNPIAPGAERLSKDRKPLDGYNRMLPPKAKAMFAKSPVEPIGVGIDGNHYAYPSGRRIKASDPHFDRDGTQLTKPELTAADAIIPALKIASIVRSAVFTREKFPVYDAFGRNLKKSRDGTLLTEEGQPLPATADLFDVCGNIVQTPTRTHQSDGESRQLELFVYNNEGKRVQLGTVGIECGYTTLLELHAEIKSQLKKMTTAKVSRITFVDRGRAISDKEREVRIASDFLPSLDVSCRDVQGKRVIVEAEPFNVEIDHAAVDLLVAGDREADFLKAVGVGRRKSRTDL